MISIYPDSLTSIKREVNFFLHQLMTVGLWLQVTMSAQRKKELDIVMEWVTERVSSKGQVPRVSDVIHYTYTTLGFRQLKPAAIARRLRLHPAYLMTSSQTRGRHRSQRYRPIVANTLGMLATFVIFP